MSIDDSLLQQLDRLRRRAHRAGRAQYLAAHRAHALHYRLGVPAIIFSTVVGASAFGVVTKDHGPVLAIVAGTLSVAAAILVALQTFLKFSERAEKHQAAGVQYNALKRRLDHLRLSLEIEAADARGGLAELATFVTEMNRIESQAPNVSDGLYDRARSEEEGDAEGI